MKWFTIPLALVLGLALTGGALAAGDYGTSGSSSEPGVSAPSQSGLPPGHPPVVLAPASPEKASEIIGKNVVDSQGQPIGQVNELMVDPSSGAVSYAVINPSSVPGMSDRLVAVPFTALQQSPNQDTLALNIDRQSLPGAPGFDRSKRPDLSGERWRSEFQGIYAPGENPSGYPPEKPPTEQGSPYGQPGG